MWSRRRSLWVGCSSCRRPLLLLLLLLLLLPAVLWPWGKIDKAAAVPVSRRRTSNGIIPGRNNPRAQNPKKLVEKSSARRLCVGLTIVPSPVSLSCFCCCCFFPFEKNTESGEYPENKRCRRRRRRRSLGPRIARLPSPPELLPGERRERGTTIGSSSGHENRGVLWGLPLPLLCLSGDDGDPNENDPMPSDRSCGGLWLDILGVGGSCWKVSCFGGGIWDVAIAVCACCLVCFYLRIRSNSIE